jgi:hypothetical protein
VKIKSELLKKAVSLVSRFTAVRSPNPCYQAIKLTCKDRVLSLFAMNAQAAFCEVSFEEKFDDEFCVYVLSEKLLGAVMSARGEVIELGVGKEKIGVAFDGGKTTINTMHEEDNRSMPEFSDKFVFSTDPEVLRAAFRYSSSATRDGGIGSGGIFCDAGKAMVFGNDMSERSELTRFVCISLNADCEEFPQINCARESLALLADACVGTKADVYASDKTIRLQSKSEEMAVEVGCHQNIGSKFTLANYRKLRQSSPVAIAEAGDFFLAAQQMAVVKLPEIVGIDTHIQKETISLSMQSQHGESEATVPCSCEGEPDVTICLNVEIVASASKCFPSKEPLVVHVCAGGPQSEPRAFLMRNADFSVFFLMALIEAR